MLHFELTVRRDVQAAVAGVDRLPESIVATACLKPRFPGPLRGRYQNSPPSG